jgi:predicted transcriptional regulator
MVSFKEKETQSTDTVSEGLAEGSAGVHVPQYQTNIQILEKV